jgi:hypothetical protein
MEHLKRTSSEPWRNPVIMIFIDGVGLGDPNPEFNPLYRGDSPFMVELFSDCKGIDAALGVKGLPQSASGHTALYTGKNAPKIQGHHMTGYPGPTLKKVIREGNIFSWLLEMGRTCTFANGYYWEGKDPYRRKHKSVTTVMSEHAFKGLRETAEIRVNRAVCQDLTRQWIREHGYDGPGVTVLEAADRLLDIAKDYDFTLFEYFQTDMLGHKGSDEDIAAMLQKLDTFLAKVFQLAEAAGIEMVLTSDHGNLEDLRTRSHTKNKVPYVTRGEHMEATTAKVESLMDITPALLDYFRG